MTSSSFDLVLLLFIRSRDLVRFIFKSGAKFTKNGPNSEIRMIQLFSVDTFAGAADSLSV